MIKRFAVSISVVMLCVLFSGIAQAQVPGITIRSVADIPTPPENEARAWYEAATGDIHVAIWGSVLVIGFEGANFSPERREICFTDPFSPIPIGPETGYFDDERFISTCINFNGLPNGTFEFSSLLPADPSIRTAEDFVAVYPSAVFRSGAPGVPEVRSQFGVIAIPEPGIRLLLIALGTCGCLTRRRSSQQ